MVEPLNADILKDIFGSENKYNYVQYGDQSMSWGKGRIGHNGTYFDTTVMVRTYDNPELFDDCPGLKLAERDLTKIDCMNYVIANQSPGCLDNYIVLNIQNEELTVNVMILINCNDLDDEQYECIREYAVNNSVKLFTVTDAIIEAGNFDLWSQVYVPVTRGAHGDIPCLWIVSEDPFAQTPSFSIDVEESCDYEKLFSRFVELTDTEDAEKYNRIKVRSENKTAMVIFNRSFCAYAGRLANIYYIRPVAAALHYVKEDPGYAYERDVYKRFLRRSQGVILSDDLPDDRIIFEDKITSKVYTIEDKEKPPEDLMEFLHWAASKG